jgi:hypothetical protein
MREAIVNYVRWAIERFHYEEPILDTCAGWEPNFYQPLFPGKRYIEQDTTDFNPPCIEVTCGRYEPHCRCERVPFVCIRSMIV